MGQINCHFLAFVVYEIAVMEIDYALTNSSIFIGVALGILLPIISNILPMRHALSKSLREALQVYKQSMTDLMV